MEKISLAKLLIRIQSGALYATGIILFLCFASFYYFQVKDITQITLKGNVERISSEIENDIRIGNDYGLYKNFKILSSQKYVNKVSLENTKTGFVIHESGEMINKMSSLEIFNYMLEFEILPFAKSDKLKLSIQYSLQNIFYTLIAALFVGLILFQFLAFLSKRWVKRQINLTLAPFTSLGQDIERLGIEKVKIKSDGRVKEFDNFFKTFKNAQDVLIQNKEIELQLNLAKKVKETSTQIAHDIKSPLAALEMINKSADSLDSESRLLLEKTIERISNMADELGREHKVINLKQIIVKDVLEEIIKEKKIEFKEVKGIEINFISDQASQKSMALLRTDYFKRVISNLINNSIEAKKEGRDLEIKVLLRSSEDCVLISVIDNGVGIPTEMGRQIFQKGFSTKSEMKNNQGLGLSHAKKIIEEFNGSIGLLDSSDRGSSFFINLPRIDSNQIYTSDFESRL